MRFKLGVVALAILLCSGCSTGDEIHTARIKNTSDASGTAVRASTETGTPAYAAVDGERLRHADDQPGQWMTYGGDYEEQRFSRLDDINTDNVGHLGLAWYADFDTNLAQESTPLVIDGVIYVSTAWSKVYAFDARTGKQLWKFDPKVPPEAGAHGCCSVVNRGLAAWKGKVYVASFDGRLIALDATTGKPVWSTKTVEGDGYTITGAPRAYSGLVVIGNAGAELGVRGYVTTYDAETGDKVWRFYTVPGNPDDGPDGEASDSALAKIAAPTWDGEFWKYGGGGTAWDALVYDPKLNLLYIGVGNGSPWNASIRSPGNGDNLFLTSIVAVNADTGDYVWHFQEVPRESWDYTATAPIMIANLKINGQMRRVVMQAPKDGFFYVLDAATGKFISAAPLVDVSWTTGINPETGRPKVNPAAHYGVTGKPYIVQPGPGGAHSWTPWSFNPGTGLVYLAVTQSSAPFESAKLGESDLVRLGANFTSARYLYKEPGNTIQPGMQTSLVAWNPVTQREAWRVDTRGAAAAGTLSTAGGLVFQGAGKELVAYRADNGRRLWSAPTQTGVVAGPVSYAAGGEQYIAQVVGSGSLFNAPPGAYYSSNRSRLLVFKLGGTAKLPPPAPSVELSLNPPPVLGDPAARSRGQQIFGSTCALCHGGVGTSAGLFPDLRYSVRLQNQKAFDAVVRQGRLSSRGMPNFGKAITAQEAVDLRTYIVYRANQLAERKAKQKPEQKPEQKPTRKVKQ